MYISEFLKVTQIVVPLAPNYSKIKTRPHVVCNDGFTMSVQAGYGLYSYPRANTLPYSNVEVGFPSENEPLLLEYSDYEGHYSSVYCYVPVLVIDKIIDKHGGINVAETFKKSDGGDTPVKDINSKENCEVCGQVEGVCKC